MPPLHELHTGKERPQRDDDDHYNYRTRIFRDGVGYMLSQHSAAPSLQLVYARSCVDVFETVYALSCHTTKSITLVSVQD